MKHSLLLLLLLLATVACKDINSTSTELSERKLPFDNNVYLTIPHTEGQSLLRKKLLNLALASQLKTALELDESSKIKSEDVFKFKDDIYKLTTPDLAKYKNFEENAAEIVVSYRDHLDIYFVPTGISREKALLQLKISPEIDERFSWVESSDEYLVKEKKYYLLSANNKEMKENDVYFNHSLEKIGTDFNEKYFSFSSYQIITLKVKAEYLIKETTYSTLRGSKIICRGSDWEAGICTGPCEYKMETATGRLVNRPLETSELIDLDIIINGRSYPLVELRPIKNEEGDFVLTLDLKKMVATDMVSIEFHQNPQYPISKNVVGIDYAPTCVNRNIGNTIDVTPSLKIDLELNVQGRNIPMI